MTAKSKYTQHPNSGANTLDTNKPDECLGVYYVPDKKHFRGMIYKAEPREVGTNPVYKSLISLRYFDAKCWGLKYKTSFFTRELEMIINLCAHLADYQHKAEGTPTPEYISNILRNVEPCPFKLAGS